MTSRPFLSTWVPLFGLLLSGCQSTTRVEGDSLADCDGATGYLREKEVGHFQCDIVVPPGRSTASPATTKQGATGKTTGLWPRGEVPYLVDSGAAEYTAAIQAAADHFNTRSPVRWIPRTTQADYVRFLKAEVNSSVVGRQGGPQAIRLLRNEFHAAVHEMGHAVGLWHEQSSPDRDAYIDINWENIRPEMQHNFDLSYGWDSEGFDFESVMLYPSFSGNTDFIIDTTAWILRAKADGATWDQNKAGLSAGDLLGLGRMYPEGAPGEGDSRTIPRPSERPVRVGCAE